MGSGKPMTHSFNDAAIYCTILFLNVYHKMFIKEFISSLRQYTYNLILVMKAF